MVHLDLVRKIFSSLSTFSSLYRPEKGGGLSLPTDQWPRTQATVIGLATYQGALYCICIFCQLMDKYGSMDNAG